MRHKLRVKFRKVKGRRMVTVMLLSACTFFLSPAMAQESINATGGNALGSGGSASYSVGQMVYTTYTGTNGSVAQGVQQPLEISIVTGIKESGIKLSISVYPNPSTDYLTLEVKDFNLTTLTLQLYDMQGRLLQTQKISNSQTNIAMRNLDPAIYFVKVMEGNKEVKTFKIIKN